MKQIAFVTYSGHPELTADDQLAANALIELGAWVDAVPWDDPSINWAGFDAVVLRSTWNYHLHPQDFTAWVDHRSRDEVRLWNPAPVLRWNMVKTYLDDLDTQGFHIPGTLWLEQGARASLPELLRERGWEQAVMKPAVSASAYRTQVTSQATAWQDQPVLDEILQEGMALVQEYIPQVVENGEWSLIFFQKRFSHAVLKRAAAGEFRVQSDHGGVELPSAPSAVLLQQARRLVSAVSGDLLYARVDGVEMDGKLVLMELELIEPSLFFNAHPLAAPRFAAALMQSL